VTTKKKRVVLRSDYSNPYSKGYLNFRVVGVGTMLQSASSLVARCCTLARSRRWNLPHIYQMVPLPYQGIFFYSREHLLYGAHSYASIL